MIKLEAKARALLAQGTGILKVAKALGLGTGTVQAGSPGITLSIESFRFRLFQFKRKLAGQSCYAH